ncbi:hypothetical protein BHM03_00010671 [Ensete ventricosum]|nr:hypothetical protein BHM03_00010671 [Ensete ventricosum]
MAPRFWSWKEKSRRRHRRVGCNVPRPSRFPAWLASKCCSSSHHPVAPVPPCLNSAFHDRDSDIVACYNPGARPKRLALGLGRAPRRRLFEARRLEIK